MELSTKYNPQQVEGKWYDEWMKHGFFRSVPDEREPYTVLIPPPNVTGVLHMGHILNNTLQDIFIRRARMQGYNACWVPGMDHASIATEAKVVRMLRERGIKKSDLTRDEFLKYAWEWKEKYGGIILQQLKKLGASCDWERTRFTMEPKLSDAVVKVFVDLYNKGYLYRDLKMINWDVAAKTTLSNEEVIYKEEQSKLYHVRYRIAGTDDEWVTIATTRPETILGDTAICVHPDDERYTHLKGKKAIVPLVGREIPFIFDEYVDMEFGTGALKVTPAHDPNDHDLGKKHNLETVDIMNDDGTLSKAAQLYIGEDRTDVRKKIVPDLEAAGYLVKVEEITNKVGYSERNPDTVVEPKLSLQWFVDMQKLAGPALENVMNDEVQFHPPKFKNTYKYWMENIRDWPISRQLWWGQQIPAWYDTEGNEYVAETAEDALAIARQKTGNNNLNPDDLSRDEDVVDTWFSSWLWPISVFDGFESKEELEYYYPSNVLVTGWDIIFFWVARMIMAGYEYMDEKPFKHVYFTGMVRDTQRRKMSKSLGNSPDALELIDRFGADGVRVGMLLSSPAGGDLLFDEKLCEQGRNFCNKIWNALRLVKGWKVVEQAYDEKWADSGGSAIAIKWFEDRLSQVTKEIDDAFAQYRVSDALMSVYKLIWDDFCSWYLEMVKPAYGEPIDSATQEKTLDFFEQLMSLLHPFTPFISEEVYHALRDRAEKDCIMVSSWPKAAEANEQLLANAELVKEAISKIREVRAQEQLKNQDTVDVYYQSEGDVYEQWAYIIKKASNAALLSATTSEPENAKQFVLKGDTFYVVTGVEVDAEAEKEKLLEELKYTKGFITSVEKKLKNERFVQGAPAAVVDKERQKLADGQAKLKALEDTLAKLN